ncbi:sigma-70 family RNA polymerase sigma factor [Nocardioides sp. SYSU DS0651]|uniref:sigma-70 family RNA polymerase sigma factor n=1 Tax=Nocardioides sp. SYSU DS0651 TaxID=3415955 RepID=UPI003F4B38C7
MTTRSDPAERRRLMSLAYRLLGSLSDAEDVVQEAYARWYALSPAERAAIESPSAWLTRVAGRLSLDVLRSARYRRERYVGEWIPEPLPGPDTDPADRVTLDESVTMAFLVVLEAMTPAERVAFVLHDVFGYSFAEVAEVVGRTPAACRQGEVVRRFRAAWQARDIEALVRLLDPAVTAVADGGGVVSAEVLPIVGAQQVARVLLDVAARAPAMVLAERVVNGQPGLVALEGGATATVFAFDVRGDRIVRIWAVRNPDKLRPWTPR